MQHKVAVYGTLRLGFGLNYVLEDSTFLGQVRAALPYSMYDTGGFPALVHSTQESPLTFEVYEVDDATLRMLDVVEGVPTLYDRESLTLPRYGEVGVYVYQLPVDGYTHVSSGDYLEYRGNR